MSKSKPITMDFLHQLHDQPVRDYWNPDYVAVLFDEIKRLAGELNECKKNGDAEYLRMGENLRRLEADHKFLSVTTDLESYATEMRHTKIALAQVLLPLAEEDLVAAATRLTEKFVGMKEALAVALDGNTQGVHPARHAFKHGCPREDCGYCEAEKARSKVWR